MKPGRKRVIVRAMAVLVTGFSKYVLADDDPFPEGFTVGDIW